MKRIYLVIRSSGEYEDYRTQVIATYLDKKLAEQHVQGASDEVKRLVEKLDKWQEARWDRDDLAPFKGKSRYDHDLTDESGFETDSTYSVETYNIRDRLVAGRGAA